MQALLLLFTNQVNVAINAISCKYEIKNLPKIRMLISFYHEEEL